MSDMNFSVKHNGTDITLNIHDLFNPIKNPFYKVGEEHKVSDLLVMLRALYTRENIEKYPLMFINLDSCVNFSNPNIRDLTFYQDLTKKLLKDVPDEDLIGLTLISGATLTSTRLITSNPGTTDYDGYKYSFKYSFSLSSGTSFSPYDFGITSTENPPETPLVLAKHLKQMATSLKVFEETHKNQSTKKLFQNAFQNHFTMYLQSFFRKTLNYSSSSNHTAADLEALLKNNPQSRITIRYNDALMNNITRFSVVIPCSRTYKEPLYTLMPYSANPMEFLSYPIKMKHEVSPVLYGIELECSSDYKIKELIDATDDPFFIAKADSSISGSKSAKYELVTVPGSIKAWKQVYAEWFSKLDYKKFDVTTQTSNGIHIHIGKKHFIDDDHISRFCWFYHNPANTELIVHVSERGSLDNMSHYTPIYQFSSGIKKFRAFKDIRRLLSGHRGATNLGTKPTVEVRIFKGIVSYASMIKNLEFCDATFHFTQDALFNSLNVAGFLKWLSNTPKNQYTTLKEFLAQLPQQKLIERSQIKDLIFAEKDPEKIYEKVIKSGIKVTQEQVSMLNKGLRRTFVLDKETGELKYIQTNIGKLAHLDRSLEKRYAPRPHNPIQYS